MNAAGTAAQRYRILGELGRGGMGVVYRAEDTDLGRQVALKALPDDLAADPERLARLRREARVLATLTHPCIVKLYGIETIGGRTLLAMELVEGTTLDRAIPRGGFPLERFFRLALPLTDAIGDAHAHGVVHRDLKPTNLIVTPEGRIKILDFGLAKLGDVAGAEECLAESTEPLTAAGAAAGTACFMAPEVIRGEPADERSDVFSLGIVLFLMVTGRHPFGTHGDGPPDVVSAILRDPPPSLSRLGEGYPLQLDRILHACLEKDPERRFQSAKDLRNQLETLEEELSSPVGPAQTPPSRSRRRLLVWNLVAAGLLILVLAVGWLASSDGPPAVPQKLPYVAVDGHRAFSGELGPRYFRDGFTRVFGERLAGLQGAWVVPPEGDPMPDLLVQTDVRRSGENVSMLIQVWDRGRRRALSNEALQGSAGAPYELLDRAADAVATTIASSTGSPVEHRPGSIPTRDGKAFDLYVRALAEASGEGPGASGRALALLEQTTAADPSFARAHALAGELRLREDPREEGLDAVARSCRLALGIDPDLAAAHLCLGRVLRERGSFAEAERELVRAVEADPALVDAYEELGGLMEGLGAPDRAESVWHRLIERHPEFWAGYWGLGRHHAASNRFEEAIEQYWRSLAAGPDNATVYWYLGAAYFLLGRYEEAIVAYQTSIAIKPTYQAYTNLGHVYLLFRRNTEAIESFEAAAAFEQERCRVVGNLAIALSRSPERRQEAVDRFETAAAACREHLEEDPRDANSWAWLSQVLANLGNEAASLDALDRAIELEPDSAHFHFFAARVHSRLGNPKQALLSLERAVTGGYPLAEIRLSAELEDLRDEPRYRELLEGGRDRSLPENR